MKRFATVPLSLAAAIALACGSSGQNTPATPAPPGVVGGAVSTPAPTVAAEVGVGGEAPLNVSLRDIGLDPESIDKSVDPCTDFYEYACGNWIKHAEIPADRPEWSHWSEINDRNQKILREILESAQKDPGTDANAQKLGAFYGACMDEKGIEARGLKPLQPYLAMIKKVQDPKSLLTVATQLDLIGVSPLFGLGSMQDLKDATQMIGAVDQAGLGLPEKEYYFRDDAESKALRAKYVAHVEKMFVLLGWPKDAAKQGAADVMAVETELAKVSMAAADRHVEENRYHPMPIADLQKLAPNLNWAAYFKARGLGELTSINVAAPDYMAGLSKLVKSVPAAKWRTYLTWQVVTSAAPTLPRKIDDENFDFYSRTLEGRKEQQPRWKRCVGATDGALGQMVGQLWVARAFPPEAKLRAEKLIKSISDAFADTVATLDWMDAPTRASAIKKRDAMFFQVGYPNKWRTYDFKVDAHEYATNVLVAGKAETQRDLNKIGKPVDKDEWDYPPQIVNAYYQPHFNGMVFLAGILQAPFFSATSSDAVNYGAIGLFAGHELTHGFDNNGAKFDEHGNLRNWWTPDVLAKFEAKGQCIVDQYSKYTVAGGVHVNGKLTETENIADGGGIKLAFTAYHTARKGQRPIVADGYNEDQQFFLAFGQGWCEKNTDQYVDLIAQTDEHSPGQYRAIGVLQNFAPFAQAFQCKAGTPMHPVNTCPVW